LPYKSPGYVDDELICGDQLPDDMVALCDWMKYAIKREFELDIEAISTTRFRGYCQGDDCP
jgi:hypothetical protein